MVFKHEKFQLDQSEQIVFDAAGNELRIFGNEYLMLEELCKKGASSLKKLAVMMGLGEFYKGGEFDKYMNRLNAHLQGQVIERQGDEYSIVGEIENTDKVKRVEMQKGPVAGEDEESKLLRRFQVSWQTMLVIGIGIAAGIWLLKYIIDMFF